MYRDEELPVQIGEGQYRLVRRLGQGGMAVVYLAEVDVARFDFAPILAAHETARVAETEREAALRERQAAWGRRPRAEQRRACEKLGLPWPKDGRAAVKVLLPQTREDAQSRFEVEWRSLLAIRHPNLIQVFGGGEERGTPWYAMEVVEGVIPVKEARGLPEFGKLDLVYQAAGGLEALHQRGVIHRDVKPANLLCSVEGPGVRVRVMDLGIAKVGTSGLTLSHHVMGTPHYMSPEQAGSSKKVDHRADVYSLGATLYSLVCGVRPYEGKSLYEVVGHLVRGERPESPREACPDLHPLIARLIERMMELDADRRLASMAVVRQTIQAIFQGAHETAQKLLASPRPGTRRPGTRRPTTASPGGPGTPARAGRGRELGKGGAGRIGRRFTLALGLGAAGVALVALVALLFSGRGREPEPERIPMMPVAQASAERPAEKPPAPPAQEAAPQPDRPPAATAVETLGRLALAHAQEGRIAELDQALARMWEAAEKGDERLQNEYLSWRGRLVAARKAWVDRFAARALEIARTGRKEEGERLSAELARLDPDHPELARIKAALEPTPGPAASPAPSQLVHGVLQATLDGKAVELPLQGTGLPLQPGTRGSVLRFSPPAKQNGLVVTVEVAVAGTYRLEVGLRQDQGGLHVHHAVGQGQPHACLQLPAGGLAQEHATHGLRVLRLEPGRAVLSFSFPEAGRQYDFGPLALVRLYADPAPPDAVKLARLRAERRYAEALALLEASAETDRRPELRRLAGHLSRLSAFERDVRRGLLLAGRALTPLSGLGLDEALGLERVAAKAGAERAAVEATFLWDLKDARALEWAENALRQGARVAELIEDIKSSRRS